jgi:DNA-binding NtrC family response regulator
VAQTPLVFPSAGERTLKQALANPERQIILDMLKKNEWNRSLTAAALGINRTTLYKKMKRLGLEGVLQHHDER